VPSPAFHPAQQQRLGADCARLIPGEAPAWQDPAKPPPPARPVESAAEKVTEILYPRSNSSARTLDLLVPGPLQGRRAWNWLRSVAADFVLVGLDWLLLGGLLVPLRGLFPRVRLFDYAAGAPASLLGLAVLHAALITLMAYTEGLYAAGVDLNRQARILAKAVFWTTALLCFAYGLQGAAWAVSGLFCAAGLLHFAALWTWRWLKARQQRSPGHCSCDQRNVLIVGAGRLGRRVVSDVPNHPEAGRRVSGFLDNNASLGDGVVGRVADLARLARTGFVDAVILAAPHDRNLTLRVLHEARRLRLDVEMVPELFGCTPGAEVERVGDLPVISLHAERWPAASLVLKRLGDVAGAGILLTALSPLLAVIALLVKLESPGPVLYSALRAGRKARAFRCCKFRTMVQNADTLKAILRQSNQRSGPFFKIADDPRITRLGRLLRRYSLDELPQLWNVLKGEMSLVGPRPHPLDDFESYDIEHLARLDVLPGITGLWQVTARRDPSFQRGMDLDREYIQTWSLGSDMRILLKTVLAVVRGSGD